jgi:RNA polymerase sigma-70 factor (ECF subfamily)
LPSPPRFAAGQPIDESDLLAAARRGDAEAYGVLVRKYQERLCSSLLYICGSLADAQDIAQEAFLRAYLKLHTFTGASAFYTWLYRIALNAAISEKRRRRARSGLAPGPDRCLTSEPSDEQLLRQERVAQVQAALRTLSPDHRTILVLRELEHCNYDEISRILVVPVGTVRSRLHRARLELRERLRSFQNS